MATTKTKPAKKPKKEAASANGTHVAPPDVMTLTEAAAYLRVSEDTVVRLVNEQNLPGRFVGDGWRFAKSGLQAWLSTTMPMPSKEAVLAAIAHRIPEVDTDMNEMLEEIYKQRGRPMTENEE